MSVNNHDPLKFEDFNGLYDRGSEFEVPIDHASQCDNVQFYDSGFGPRNTFVEGYSLAANPVHFEEFVRSSGTRSFIYMDSSRNLYHTGAITPSTAIITAPAGTTCFSMVSIADRAYISFHNYALGNSAINLKVYYEKITAVATSSVASPSVITTSAPHSLTTGQTVTIAGHAGSTPSINGNHVVTVTGVTTFTIPVNVTVGGTGGTVTAWIIRDAMGARPTVGTFAAATSASAGVVASGYHLFRVAYLTDTGFITKVSTAIAYNAPGLFSVDLTNIPVGPVGTVARHILVTKAIPTTGPLIYDGNPDHYEPFFLTLLNDNSTTSLTVNFYDSQLVSSADYLQDTLASIISPLGIGKYQNSMVIWGMGSSEYTGVVYISKPNDFECFDVIDSALKIDATDGSSRGIFCCTEFRGSLVIDKRGRTYVATNTGDIPANWPIILVDGGIGGQAVFGVARTEASQTGIYKESLFKCDLSGLYLYNGTYADRPLTWKIENLWRQIDESLFTQIKVVVQATTQKVYVVIPKNAANFMLVGDFSQGLDSQNIKWSKWYSQVATFPLINAITAESVQVGGSSLGVLIIYNGQAKIYRLTTAVGLDAGVSEVQMNYGTATVPLSDDLSIIHLNEFRMYGGGSTGTNGEVVVQVYDAAGNLTTQNFFVVATGTVNSFKRKLNRWGGAAKILYSTYSNDPLRIVNRMWLFGNKLWESTPQ